MTGKTIVSITQPRARPQGAGILPLKSSGPQNVLVDYVGATDSSGQMSAASMILHVYVGDGKGEGLIPSTSVHRCFLASHRVAGRAHSRRCHHHHGSPTAGVRGHLHPPLGVNSFEKSIEAYLRRRIAVPHRNQFISTDEKYE